MAKRSRKTTPIKERLLRNTIINPDTDCWEWQGAVNNVGYGMIRDEDKMRTTHRVSYEEHSNKSIPKDMCVLHTCDNPRCVNPAHLWIGTHTDNMRDMIKKERNEMFIMPGFTGTCEHCGATMRTNLLKRWHNDNCKHRPTDK